MQPYYEQDGVTIYHGDCREFLAAIPGSDLLLADPPYGMDHEPTRRGDGSKRWGGERVHGDNAAFDPAHLLGSHRTVLWGANWYADKLPPSGGWLVWDKTPRGAKEGFTASHAELAWTNLGGSVRKFSLQWGGEAHGGEPQLHPTQKPVALMEWVVKMFSHPGELVIDPYMGSGPVAEACRRLGRRYIGIELREHYCDKAAERLRQMTLNFGAA